VNELIAFVQARRDEDQRAAKRAPSGPWEVDGDNIVSGRLVVARDCILPHIVRHDPGRVLADVAAVRAIVARYEDCLARLDDPDYSTAAAADQIREYEDFVLPSLALPYADHPDYREEWKP
jgi:hypothetical protein